ncbi:aminotransferase class I/II-fold pyridoxal phosphate-dependent enzyme [Bacillus chungangensis]|uniref:Arginine/lysine/ornithine decarboxylase n=1 Tax=Bacillus chungangensis TaxID=587633 RepID=A0ABT9WXA9_9BACI|nr:aminotransferase class I/II-fold pyridoxal phosphate-dependent enzyme [Bacillus chungangensis]MDQ0177928.1 arginine/lysine/ornithine decarboxylase [Bacillus chungangensis]
MNQNQMPLYDFMSHFSEQQPISFHVPGHKNGFLLDALPVKRDFRHFLKYDVTELPGLDDLHAPEGIIAQAEALLSDFYQTVKSYFLVNGSTVGNLAMILALCKEGDTVFVQRNAHKSIFHALMLAKVQPIFLSPEIDQTLGVAGGLSIEAVKKAFEQYPNAKACIFTYPHYYGLTYDLKSMIEVAHAHGSYVLVDEAHGPHFILGEPFPPSAISLGADIIVQSAHKMLPAMTMGSFLHINTTAVAIEKVTFYLGALQSSSPSYPIMASLDMARYYLSSMTKDDICYTIHERNSFVKQLHKNDGIIVQEKEQMDPLKIALRLRGISGYELQERFIKNGIYPELADPYQVLLVWPLLKSGCTFPSKEAAEKINKSISDVNINRKEDSEKYNDHFGDGLFKGLELSYQEIENRQIRWVPLEKAENEIAAKMVIPYPPGVPLLITGEKISRKTLMQLQFYIKMGAKFQEDDARFQQGFIAIFI